MLCAVGHAAQAASAKAHLRSKVKADFVAFGAVLKLKKRRVK
jgi:hypothetical protein